MKNTLRLTLTLLLFAITAFPQTDLKNYKFENGSWFTGKRFERTIFYSVGGVLSKKRPTRVDETVDLNGGYVIPPFGDAHTHNLDGAFNLDKVSKAYIDEGTYYVQVLGNSSAGAAEARPKLNKAETPDVTYANGMLTRTYGHPFMVYEPLAMGIYDFADAYKRIDEIKKSRRALGRSYWFLDSTADVDATWPKIIAANPDVIKIGLLDAAGRQDDPANQGVGGGLSPEVAEYVVRKAHDAKLRVFAHVETAEDFRIGLRIGVDGFAHAPGYGWDGRVEIVDDLTEKDLKLAAKKKVVVIPTAARGRFSYTDFAADGKETVDEKRKQRVIARQKRLLREMQKAGVTIALGLDNFGMTAIPEIMYFAENQIFDNLTLLRIATEDTPRSIFPDRRIGRLTEGFEANFLVLSSNPLNDFSAVKQITMRFKAGAMIGKK